MAGREGSGQITTLRDRKREKSRAQTVEAAWRLFTERGYDHVTVADICARAEIAPRTFHRYFASKEDLVAEPVRYMNGLVAEHLAAAPAEMDDTEALRAALSELGAFVLKHHEWLGALRAVVQQSHQLRDTHGSGPPEREQERLAALLAERRPGAPEAGWRRRLLVAYASAAFRIWYDDYLRGELADPLARLDEMLETIGTAR